MTGELRGAFRSVLLGWTDPVSGERLTVRMRGDRGMIDSLGTHGFELLEAGAVRALEQPLGRLWNLPRRRRSHRRQVRSLLAPGTGEPDGTAAAG